MKLHANEEMVQVFLPAHFVEALLRMHTALDTDVAGTLEASIASQRKPLPRGGYVKPTEPRAAPQGKYAAEFLGTSFGAQTLPEVFAKMVDITARIAPDAADELAAMSGRTRRYVARKPEAIHPGNTDLPVIKTASGWWISKNIGREDLERGIRALCRAANLTFGVDVKLR